MGHVPARRGCLAAAPRLHRPAAPPTVNNGERLPPIRVTTSCPTHAQTRRSSRKGEKIGKTRPPAPAPNHRPSSLSPPARFLGYRRRLPTRPRQGTHGLARGGGRFIAIEGGGTATREPASHHRPDNRSRPNPPPCSAHLALLHTDDDPCTVTATATST